MITLSSPVQFVRGVGEERAKILEKKGITTAEDLLYYVPFRYEDRTRVRGPGEVRQGEMATVIAEVASTGMLDLRRSHMKIFRAVVEGGGRSLNCKWFNAAYLQRIIKPGQFIALYGKVEFDPYEGGLQMSQPQYEILPAAPGTVPSGDACLEIGRIVPIYESAGNGRLTSRFFRRVIHFLLENLAGVDDPLPPEIAAKILLSTRWEAIRNIHFPPQGSRLSDLANSRSTAHRRLIFEEFFYLEARLALKRKRMREIQGIAFHTDARIRECLKAVLPFHPTDAQKKALAEIAADMRAPHPMHRLLQGEVGSGKTLVALQAALIAMENGCQVVLMAPTEVLAAQHFFLFRRLLAKTVHNVILLSGSATKRQKLVMKRLLREGLAHLAIGTQALVEDDVEIPKLGLVIIDEQHRFGVMQRFNLVQKGRHPDMLVMTATPIPRTLALTMYGDLDVSTIAQLPGGRLPIVTRQIPSERAAKAYEFVRTQVNTGAQAYIIYPLIEEIQRPEGEEPKKKASAKVELKAAQQMYEHLSEKVFPEFRVGLMHGRLSNDEKERVMAEFQSGHIQILVATTVVEVGVDVPNASVMLIEQAERFGLTQLHQLRGRVGRGSRKSYCILVSAETQTDSAKERLATMERTTNGFEIAETDLRLRGPGEFLGTKQSGLPALRIANLLRDQEILDVARNLANDFIEQGEAAEVSRLTNYLKGSWDRRYGMVSAG